jgi:hypothetical protein
MENYNDSQDSLIDQTNDDNNNVISSYYHPANNNNNKTKIEITKKWKCSKCTYENWPSALKCTICLCNKTSSSTNSSNGQFIKKNLISLGNNNNNDENIIINYNKLNSNNSNSKKNNSNDNNNNNNNNNKNLNISLNKKNTKKPLITNDIYKLGDILLGKEEDEDHKNNKSNGNLAQLNSQQQQHTNHNNNGDQQISTNLIDQQKWTCSICTYLNWPKSNKCVQCYTEKFKTNNNKTSSSEEKEDTLSSNNPNNLKLASSNNGEESQSQSQTQTVIINNDTINTNEITINNDKIKLKQATINTKCINQLSITKSPSISPAPNSNRMSLSPVNNNNNKGRTNRDKNKASSTPSPIQEIINNNIDHSSSSSSSSLSAVHLNINTNSLNHKWICSECTYQNWPKSNRCVMCNAKFQPTVAAITSVTNSNNITNNNTNPRLTVTPPPQPQPQPQQQPQHQPQPQIRNNNNNSPTFQLYYPTVNKHIEMLQQLQQKKRSNQMDRLFLIACEGIVDGDMTYLNRYINAGGNLSRYLTMDDVKQLNRPMIFTVGLTLIHLCYQFKRKEFLFSLSKSALSSKDLSFINNINNINQHQQQQQHQQKKHLFLKKNKFSPCQSSPSLAVHILNRYFLTTLRQRKSIIINNNGSNTSTSTSSPNTTTANNINNNASTSSSMMNGCMSTSTSSFNGLGATCGMLMMNQSPSPSPSPPPFGISNSGQAASLFYQAYHQQNGCGGCSNSGNVTFLCFYVNECHTFMLPKQIEQDFVPRIKQILFDELLDREVQHELEYESRIINWNVDLCKRLNSRLYPLWNRHSGDCLLDSVLQACYGIFDTDNALRRVMAESMEQYSNW